jgi:molybdopterin-guanine dinucleotide biosynthesis protein A
MGRDKALLPLDSGPLVERIASRVTEAAGKVALVGKPEQYQHLGFDCLPDLRNGLGPLAGIEAALASERGELNLIVACDMPNVKTGWLRDLVNKAEDDDALCIATRDVTGMVHPLCAVYRNTCFPIVRNALERGQLRLLNLLDELSATYLQAPGSVLNLNTPDEWSAWQAAESR